MKTFDVQSIEVQAPFDRVFDYLAKADNLPEWTSAFKSVGEGRARLHTPNGSVEIALAVNASRAQGTVDWKMTFPDGNITTAYSRVVKAGNDHSIYSFILMAPPVPLERLEGALEQQSRTLQEELGRLLVILSEK